MNTQSSEMALESLKILEVVVASELVIAKVFLESSALGTNLEDFAVSVIEKLLFERHQREILVWVVDR
jgi:hypothetical protein